MFALLAPILGGIAKTVAGSLFPDPADKVKMLEAENAINLAVMSQAGKIDSAAASIINTEAASTHWLAATWRPITMLVFVGLIVSRWMGYGAEGMSEAEYLEIYTLIKIGLGGYIVGRSAEKIVPRLMKGRSL